MAELRVQEVYVHPDRMPNPTGYRILVEPISAIAVTEGGIELAGQTITAQEYLRHIGRVIAIGPNAYQHDKFASMGAFGKMLNALRSLAIELGWLKAQPVEDANQPWIKAGDYIAWHQYAGQDIRVRGQLRDGTPAIAVFKLINDDEVLCEIPDPQSVLLPF